MPKRRQLLLMIFFASNYLCLTGAVAVEPVDNSVVTTKHFHYPFVHIDVARHKDGTKDVDVRAPFTKVHNPAGADNAEVKAPFYKEEHSKNATGNNVKAPLTTAQKSANKK